MKKLFILLGSILFLTGCTAEYDITLNKNTILERLDLYETSSELWDEKVYPYSKTYRELVNSNYEIKTGVFKEQQNGDTQDPNENYIYYKKEKIESKERLGLSYQYEFLTNDYKNSYLARSCYDYVQLYKSAGEITLSTSKEFKCIENYSNLDEVKINVTTKYNVIEENADSSNGHTYTWVITKNNYSDNHIYLKIDLNELAEKTEEEKEHEEKILKILVTIGIIFIVLVIIFILYLLERRRKLEND